MESKGNIKGRIMAGENSKSSMRRLTARHVRTMKPCVMTIGDEESTTNDTMEARRAFYRGHSLPEELYLKT